MILVKERVCHQEECEHVWYCEEREHFCVLEKRSLFDTIKTRSMWCFEEEEQILGLGEKENVWHQE